MTTEMSERQICWFFQRNSCRFGSNCRNIHVYEGQEQQQQQQRSRTPGRKTVTFREPVAEQSSGVSVLQRNRYVVNNPPQNSVLNQYLEEVKNDIAASDGIWPASCYSYLPTHGNLQGFEDFSPEEMRLRAYRDPQEYMHDVNHLKTNIVELKKSFLNKTPAAQEALSDYMKHGPSRVKQSLQPGPVIDSSIESSQFFLGVQNPQASGFFSPSQSNGSFSLNSHPAFRGQPQTTSFDNNIFAQALNEDKQSAFGQTTSVFGQPIENTNVFKQNIFGGATQSKANLAAAQASQSSSQFSFSNAFSSSVAKSDFPTKISGKCFMYSQEDDLTPEELEQFKATTFTYGKTPLNCPPKELC